MEYCAEATFIKLDGRKVPLEISFASVYNPDKVYVLEMDITPNISIHFRDLAELKSLYGNKDRLHRQCGEIICDVMPIVYEMHLDTWWTDVQEFVWNVLGDDVFLGVRSTNQLNFFKNFFQNVTKVNILNVKRKLGCYHQHKRLVKYACTTVEARSLAAYVHWQRLYS
jgi:hypothetical protein